MAVTARLAQRNRVGDPGFWIRAGAVCRLYLNPPPGTALISVDGKTDIQAKSRKHPQAPARPGQRASQLRKAITGIERRKRSLVTELDSQPASGDPDADREYRQAIQQRFTELVAEHRTENAELAKLDSSEPAPVQAGPGLLDALPQLPLRFADMPEPLQRSLYEAFQLQIRYHRPRHDVTIRAETLPDIAETINNVEAAADETAIRSHVLCAPSRAHSTWERAEPGKLSCSGGTFSAARNAAPHGYQRRACAESHRKRSVTSAVIPAD